MANESMISKTPVSSLAPTDKVFVNAGNKVTQITLENLNNSLKIINEAELSQIAFYTDFNETGDTVLGQGGNLALADYIFGTVGNYLLNNAGYAAKLNPTNPTLFSDGATAPLDGSKGHEMTLLPGFHYLVSTNPNGKPRFWVSNKSIGGHHQAPHG